MPTFLVTRRWPALAARVEASVRGVGRRSSEVGRRVVAVARFAVVALIVGIVCTVAYARRRDRQQLQRARAAAAGDVRAKSAEARSSHSCPSRRGDCERDALQAHLVSTLCARVDTASNLPVSAAPLNPFG